MNICLRKLPGQTKRFRIFFTIGFLSLIISYFLFATLNYRTNLNFVYECVRNCTIEQSKEHGLLFASFQNDWSSCYGDFYLTAFDNHNTSVEVLIDVGANKAYAIAAWLAFFLPEFGINQARLGAYILSNKHLSESCGSCNDCQDEPLKQKNIRREQKLQIHAFEPQPGTVTLLREIKDWMKINKTDKLLFEIHGMAVSNETGQTLFKKCNAGNEVCSLDVSGVPPNSQIYINVTTLDDFANNHHLSKIDIIKIDTEGYDPLVFHGAKRLLREHRIRLFIFEHLMEGAWRHTSLQAEVLNLSTLGYACYIIGKTGLIRISNCWNDKFNVRHCNLLCVSSKDKQLWNNIDQMRLNGTLSNKCETISKR